ncbi:solute carrier family 22 member 5-like isoform X2 [Pectinophora gossypiella]|uniref:solute carrier family 22 member 5-like isoform X2 n=1 Tax=Pectinophora gossypiella TaxID=13191 RepID=UPI00214E97E7|nr:solute carrier family 22 member 5-like isoform X2 [Pectinophora gossypiella]
MQCLHHWRRHGHVRFQRGGGRRQLRPPTDLGYLRPAQLRAACCSTAAYTLTMTYLGECTGSVRRRRYLFVMNSFNLLADFIFYFLAYLILPLTFSIAIPWLGISLRPWRVYSLILAAPLGLGAVMLLMLRESPKLLASRGRMEEALDVLRKMYEWNGGNKDDYPVKVLSMENVQQSSGENLWRSVVSQTVPLFKPPLLWRTMQLFYLFAICTSTNNVFLLWYPMIVNLFFNSHASGAAVEDQSFCQRVVANISTSIEDDNYVCDDTISLSTMYAGMLLGVVFALMNLAASAVAAYRKLVLMVIFLISTVCLALVELLREPVSNMVAFTMVQCTAVGVSSVASYFVDLYPTAYRGLGTSLGIMFGRLIALGGVNLVGAIIIDHCTATFYSWMVFVASGIVVALFLPKDSKQYK